jgi:hypothetical protein
MTNTPVKILKFALFVVVVLIGVALTHNLDGSPKFRIGITQTPRFLIDIRTTPATVAPHETLTPTASPAPIWQVCTGLATGHLNVRASAGSTAAVLGALSEAVPISPTGQRNGDWFQIRAPLAGWVHSNFICEGSAP